MSLLNRLWSGADFWEKEENQKQRQQFAQTRAQQQPRPVVQTRSAPTLQNNRNIQPRVRDQITRSRTIQEPPKQSFWNKVTDVVDPNSPMDQYNRLRTGQPQWYDQQSIKDRLTRSAETGGRILARNLQGIGQDVGGAYDLLSPGHGVNRFTKMYAERGAQTDQQVKDMGLDNNLYKIGQLPGAVASYALPGKVVSNIGKVPQVAKNLSKVGKVLNKAPGVAKATGYVDDLAASSSRLQRVGGKMLQSYRQPGAMTDVVVDALQNAGHRTSLGQDNSLSTAGLDIGMSLGMQGGLNLAGQAVAPAIQTTTRLAKNTANNLMDSVAPVQTTTRLVKNTNRLNLDTTDALKAYSDMLVDADPYIQGKVRSDLIANVRDIGDQLGVDLTNGSVVDQMERIEAILNGYLPTNETGRKLALTPLGEGGYAKNPFYRGDDITAGLSEQQAEFINDYANMLEGMGAGNGVDITPDGRRISNNFRDADTAGRTMTKQDWFEKARKDIESGKAGFGASDDYKKLPGVKSDPLESLKQEARKYKSADEFIVSKIGRTSIFDPKRAELRAIYDEASPKTPIVKNKRPERPAEPERWVAQKPIKMPNEVYRGVGKDGGTGMSMYGSGLYTAAGRKEAAKYGKVTKLGKENLPKNPLQFKTDLDFSQWQYEMAKKLGVDRKDLYGVDEGVEKLVKPLGYDGITIGQGKEMIAVKYGDDLYNQATQSQPPKPTAVQPDPLESLKQEARPPANAFQDTLPSKSRPASIRELVKRGGNPLYHDTNASGVLGILDSGEIRASQAPFSQIAGQGKRVSTTRNFDNYSRYGKSPYRFVIDETKTGQKAIPDNREEFESIFKNNVKTDSVETLAIDITNPEIINDMNNGRLAEVIAKAKEKGIRVETFEGKILPDEYANKEIQQLTKDRFTKEFGKATQPPKSTPVQPDPLESLKQEARKYKSAEEFVKAKTNQYHGTLDKEFKLDPNSRLFLTGDTDSASTYAGRRYNQEPEGKVVGYHAKDGKTLDLNDNATREEYVRDVLGQNKQLKKYYDQIPESARNDYFDTLGWVMEEHKAGRIPKADLDKYTEAQKNYKGISSKDVYANWDKIIARAKKDGYDYIKHTTEDPSAEITFPETVALNPSKTILDKQQLTDLYDQATQPPKSTPVQPDPLESLKQEARKYKSAEEFVKAQGEPLYHGTSAQFDKFDPTRAGTIKTSDWGKGTYFDATPDGADYYRKQALRQTDTAYKQAADRFMKASNGGEITTPETQALLQKMREAGQAIDSGTSGRVIEARLKPGAKVLDYEPTGYGVDQSLSETAAKQGYDAVRITDGNGKTDEMLVINPDAVYTKQQLTDLYNQATQPPKPTPVQKQAPQPTKGASTPQRQVVNNTTQVEPVQGRTPNQSQSVDIETPQRVERPVSSPEQKTTKAQQKTPPREINQVRPDRTSSSDDIIDLDRVDVNDPFGNSSPVKKLRNEFGRMFIDEDSEMINLLKRVEKETDGQDLVERWLQDSDMVRNSNSIANSKIRTNQNLRDAVQGLRKKEVAEFDAYAAARSELANVKRGLDNTSRSVDELQNIVNKHGQKYSQRFESLNRYYNDLANDLYDAGIIDKAKRDTWAKNKDYVRVQRDMEDLLNPGYGASKSRSFGSTSTTKKRTGSKREILSSTQTALKRTQELQLEIQRNKAASNTIDLLSKHGLATRISGQQATGKNVIKRFKNGKVEYFATHKDIKRVMDNVNPFQLGIIAKVVSAPTRVFRAGTTALSAPFAVTNYLRDQASSAIYSKSVMRTHNPVAIVSGLYQGVKDFGGGRNSKLWERFQRYAGDQTMFDETRNAKNSKAMLNQLRRGGGKYARAVELINPVNTVRNLEDLISITEKSTRYQNFRGIYKKTLKETGNEDIAIQKATQAALQNSVNFSRAGSVTRIVNLMFPYFNAGIQGSRNVGRSLRDRPIQTVTKSAAFVAAPTIGAVLYNYSSEESKRIYENLPENEKENNIVFVLPGAKQREDGTYEGIIKIPKPQGYRELTDPLRVVAEKFAGDTDTKSIGEMAKDMTAAFTGPVQTEDMNKFMSTFVPQTIKPILQAHLNRDLYWGSETVPDYMMEGTDDPTKRAYKGTSGMARWVANQLGVEPIKVEKFIVDSTGSLGRYGINAVDNVLAAQGKIPKEQIGGRSIVDDFSRRMFEARGIEKEEKNMTDGQKYFKAVKEATTGLSPQQKVAWDSYNQSNKNFLGEELYDKSSFAKKQAKAAAYAQFPGLFEVDKKVDAQARQRGEPGNPLYDLNFNQAFKVVQQKAMLPGAKDPELDNLYDHQWYEDFKKKESDYYDKVFADKKDEDLDNPYPKRSEQLTAAMNHYYDLDTSQRRAWRNANPGLYDQFKQYYAAKDAWEDRERIKIGLGPISQHKNSFYGKSGSGGGQGRSGGRKSRLAFEPFKYVKKSSHLNKELRALIEAAGAPSKAFPKAKKTPNYS